MKKFLIGLVAGVLLAALTGVVLLFSVARLGERRPTVTDGSTLVVRLAGDLPERPPLEYPLPLLKSRSPTTIHEIWRMLDEAADDTRIEALALFPRNLSIGWARLQEVRSGLVKFRESGKPVVAFLRNPGGSEYYLATAADQVYMAREDILNVKGLRAEMIFFRNTLDKLGVQVEIEHAGKYKDAGDMFTRTSMSPETREVLDSALDLLYGDFLSTVAQARDHETEEIRAIVDEGPFLAGRAIELGLVDELLFEDQVFDKLREQLGQEKIKKLAHRDYLRSIHLGGAGSDPQIALIVGEGTITGGVGEGAFSDDGLLRSGSFARILRQVAKNDRIQGAILRINSPGGDAIASDEMLREVRRLREKKPLVISMSDVAASGGYYLAMTGDPVIAYPNTFTGSIGVIYGKVNLRGFYDKIGIRKEFLTRGRFADIDTDYKPLSGPARDKLREGVDAVYRNFLQVVADGRKQSPDQIEPVAQGRVWLGEQASENGLVDELGGLDRAVELIKDKVGISPEENVRLVTFPRRRNLFDYLFEERESSLIEARLTELLGGLDVRVLRRGGILKMMPYVIRIR